MTKVVFDIYKLVQQLPNRDFLLIKILGNGKRPNTQADTQYLVRHMNCGKEFVVSANDVMTGKKCPCCHK